MPIISDRLGISNEIHELKFGKSFANASTNPKFNSNRNSFNSDNGNNESYHTIRYDFKPVSVDTAQTATIEFNEKNKITVTAPNIEGSGMACTVFQGSRKPHLKECVLVFDHETGDFTLERLTNNIVVKKTRAEGSSKILNQQRPITPAGLNQKSISPKLSNQNGTTKSPPNSSTGNTHLNNNLSHISPKDRMQATNLNVQPLNSMPIFNSSTLTPTNSAGNSMIKNTFDDHIGVLSSSSSSSSSSDDSSSSSSSSSSSEDDEDNESIPQEQLSKNLSMPKKSINNNQLNSQIDSQINMSASSSEIDDSDDDDEKLSSLNNNLINSLNNELSNVGISNNNNSVGFSMPKLSDLNDDLQLSESGSDSD